MGGLLVTDIVQDDCDNVDTHAPILNTAIDQVSGQVFLAMAPRPNSNHLIGLEHQVGRKLIRDLLLGVDTTLEQPVGHGDIFVATCVL